MSNIVKISDISQASKDSAYVTFDQKSKGSMLDSYNPIIKSDNFTQQQYTRGSLEEKAMAVQFDNNITVRNPFMRYDYEWYRPNEHLPSRWREIIHACRGVYLRVPMIRQATDTMTDFAAEGVKLVHGDKKTEILVREWAKKVDLERCVDQFAKHLLVDSNVVVKRTTGKLTHKVGGKVREIPVSYKFLNVAALLWIGGDSSRMLGEKRLGFRLSQYVINAIRNPTDPLLQSVVDRLPIDLKVAAVTNSVAEIDMSTVYVGFGKKDDWENWSPPQLYCVLNDVFYKDKLRQAEVSAIDGLINVIRLWKLGDHKEGILPSQKALDKLVSVLEANTGGGSMDIIWDTMIEMTPYYPPVDKILGPEKYDQVNRDLLIGLGFPEVLMGGKGANFSNSIIQIKPLVEKLKFIRKVITGWINNELKLFCDAMDIKDLPIVEFDYNNLDDENAIRKLLISLLDRGIISSESVLDTFGKDVQIETKKQKNEENAGLVPKSPLDKDPVDESGDSGSKPKKKKSETKQGVPGRPSSTFDIDRQKRTPKVRTASIASFAEMDLNIKGSELIDLIDNYVGDAFLRANNLNNARQLTNDQKDKLDLLRRGILSLVKPSDPFTTDVIDAALTKGELNTEFLNLLNENIGSFTSKSGKEPNISQKKQIEAMSWASYYSSED